MVVSAGRSVARPVAGRTELYLRFRTTQSEKARGRTDDQSERHRARQQRAPDALRNFKFLCRPAHDVSLARCRFELASLSTQRSAFALTGG